MSAYQDIDALYDLPSINDGQVSQGNGEDVLIVNEGPRAELHLG